jgi:nicotinate-nucleotide adenylyltransferase
MKKIGILGGTFNPIHFGHLRAAEEIREDLSLDKVIFIPSGIPPHRPASEIVSFAHRYEMVKLAIAHNPSFSISDIEGQRAGKSYTVDTLKLLKEKINAEFYFIIGLDAFLEINTWKSPKELFTLTHFIVMPRKGFKQEEILTPLKRLFAEEVKKKNDAFILPTGKCVYFCHISSLNISATHIRRLLAEGRSIRYLVPKEVADYIYKKGLYRRKDGEAKNLP